MIFLPQEVIARKRDGEPLTAGEIRSFVSGLVEGSVSHAQAAAFAIAVQPVREHAANGPAIHRTSCVENSCFPVANTLHNHRNGCGDYAIHL